MVIHRIKITLTRTIVISLSTFLCCLTIPHFPIAQAWDSASWKNPTHPGHSYLTEWAIDQINPQFPEVETYRKELLEGANTELHELEVSGTKYGINLNAKRIQHKGTNEGCDDIQGWWKDSLSAYQNGNKQQAYFLTGIMLHMIEDMGVPAHANKVYHQGNATNSITSSTCHFSTGNPILIILIVKIRVLPNPWKYYAFSKNGPTLIHLDSHDRSSFSKTWSLASQEEKALLRNRQARTATVFQWALHSAVKAFNDKPQKSNLTINLAGTWIVEGYGCEPGVWYKEKIQISVNENYLIAKKITGDNCVPAGNITFQGTLPDSLSEGTSFPLTWTIGSPSNPASGKTILNLTVLNKNSFSVNGTKFNRVTR